MTDALIAEALAAADSTNADRVPAGLGECRYLSIGPDAMGWWRVFSGTNDSVPAPEYNAVRRDVMDAALRHLAERVERLRAGLASFGVDPLGWEPSVLAATILNDDAGGGRSDVTCESWQERATRAEAALMRIVEIGDGVGFDVAVAALRTAGLLDAEETDDG